MTNKYISRIIPLVLVLLISNLAGAQSTLKINTPPSNTDGRVIISSSNVNDPDFNDGIIIPRMNVFPGDITSLNAGVGPASTAKGMLVYLQAAYTGTTGTPGVTVGTVYPVGFYYWTGTLWVPISGSSGSVNIYNSDGTLTGTRTVTMGTNTLNFTGANVGISAPAPGSTLQVVGSFAPNYNNVTAATYAMAASDFYVVYSGSTASAFTLPVSVANMKGRLYNIKNTTAAQTLTVTPAGSETIDGSSNISIPSGTSVQLVNTGLTGANPTWEIVSFNSATAPNNNTGNLTIMSSCGLTLPSTYTSVASTTGNASGSDHRAVLAAPLLAAMQTSSLISVSVAGVTAAGNNQIAIGLYLPAPNTAGIAGRTFVFFPNEGSTNTGSGQNDYTLVGEFLAGTTVNTDVVTSNNVQNIGLNLTATSGYGGTLATNSGWTNCAVTSRLLTQTSTGTRRMVRAVVMTSTGDSWVCRNISCPTLITYKQ